MDYEQSGVSLQRGQEFIERIRRHTQSTHRPGVLGGIGQFGGLFALPTGYQEPVLVSGTDGVGTKLKLAFALNRHDTIGIDCVAMNVNDVLCQGAEPLFFLDYLATGKLEPEVLEQVVAGIAQGCREAGCALLGGETAEMPGFYPPGEYDLAGFCVGIVERAKLFDSSRAQAGDQLIGLASSGLHSNGFSLVRRIIATLDIPLTEWIPELGATLGDCLLTPTRIYVQPIRAALQAGVPIHGLAHITGGGLIENLPRCLPLDLAAHIERGSWPLPGIFSWLQKQGQLSQKVLDETFNQGIGMVLVVPPEAVTESLDFLHHHDLPAWRIGSVVPVDGARLIFQDQLG